MNEVVTIPLAELKLFKKESSHIKGNRIIPIYDFIKFEDGTIIKTNSKEFIVKETNASFKGTFLVEDLILNSFIENTVDPEIHFKIGKDEVTIYDSKSKLRSKTADLKQFPATPELPPDPVKINAVLLAALSVAEKFTRETDNNDIYPNVFMGEGGVGATDDYIGYFEAFDFDVPKVIIPKAAAYKIGQWQEDVFLYPAARYLLFKHQRTLYGFIKPEAKFMGLAGFFKKPTTKSFTVDKNDIISFNNTCLSVSPTTYTANMEMKEGKLVLSMRDDDLNRDNIKEVTAAGDILRSFNYSPTKMNQLLKNLPDNEVTFYEFEKLFYVTGANSEYVALVMELMQNNKK